MASAAQESIWLQQLICELTNLELSSMLIYEDNQSAIAMAKNPQFHGRAKHIEIKRHFVVARGTIKLQHCPSSEMIADMLTKGLSQDSHIFLRGKSGMIEQ